MCFFSTRYFCFIYLIFDVYVHANLVSQLPITERHHLNRERQWRGAGMLQAGSSQRDVAEVFQKNKSINYHLCLRFQEKRCC